MLKTSSIDEWDKFYKGTTTASYFQSSGWSQVWSRYTGGRLRPAPLVTILPSGKKVLVPLTRQRLRGGLGSLWHAAPAGTYGGWLTEPGVALTEEELQFLIRSLFRYCGSLIFRMFPMTPVMDSNGIISNAENLDFFADHSGLLSGISCQEDYTRLIDCSVGYDALSMGWSAGKGKMKWKIKKAVRSGVQVRKAIGEKDIATYYRMYLDASKRWDPPPTHVYSSSFFDLLLESGMHSVLGKREQGTDGPCEMWVAEHDGQVIAGAIILTGNQYMSYWHGVFDPEYRAHRPVNLLLSTLIEECCKRGLRWFDFNPSMGIESVDHFKQSFGAQSSRCPVLKKSSGLVRAATMTGKFLRRLSKGDSG